MKQNKNINYSNFTDEDRAAIVVRYLAGEDEGKLAKEIGATPQVIEAWAGKVAQAVGQKKNNVTTEEDKEIENKISELQGEVKQLQGQIQQMRKFAEMREVILEANSKRPIFFK